MILFHTFRKEIQVFIHKPHKLHNTNPVPHCLKMNAPSAHIIVSQPRKAPTYKPAKIDWSTAQEEKKKHRECYERNWSIFTKQHTSC